MLTGTPLDLTPFGAVLQGIGLLYWLLVAGVLALIFTKIKRPRTKWLSVIAVLVIMVGPVILHGLQGAQQHRQAKEKLNAGKAQFEARCKGAGEKITKTVENVDGLVWMKWRPEVRDMNRADQFKLDDPYGTDCYGEECIKRLLRVSKGAELNSDEAKEHTTGYQFVETIDPRDGSRYRYIGVIKSIAQRTPDEIAQYKKNRGIDPGIDVYGFSLERESIAAFTARYGLTWDDISTREDREKWIAGGVLQVIDLQTDQVIAERRGYLIDPGQGSTAGFRDPWSWARGHSMPCPQNSERTWTFAFKIAQPSKTER